MEEFGASVVGSAVVCAVLVFSVEELAVVVLEVMGIVVVVSPGGIGEVKTYSDGLGSVQTINERVCNN